MFGAQVDGQENPLTPCPSDLNPVGLGKRTGKTGLKSASGAATWASASNPFALGLPPASPFLFLANRFRLFLFLLLLVHEVIVELGRSNPEIGPHEH